MLIDITEEQYNVLREITGQYEIKVLQAAEKARAKINHIKSFNRGDYIIYIGGSESKYLTKLSRYRLTGKPFSRNRVSIINDNGKRVVCKDYWFEF